MTKWTTRQTVEALRWVLGVVVLWASCRLLQSIIVTMQVMRDSGHIGPHVRILLVLASLEIVAAVMFLAPVLDLAGSYLLLTVFAFAILFHLLQRQFDFGALFVYAMVVVVWLAHRKEPQAGVRDVR
jgi:hypothetical protein